MTILLDTHVWLWTLGGSSKLKKVTRKLIEDPETQVFVSSISVWEVSVKRQLGKLEIDGDLVTATRAQQMIFLPFDEEHAAEIESLPLHHKDPFDRALIAQASMTRIRLLTADRALLSYRDSADIAMV